MSKTQERFARNIGLFGQEGQRKLGATRVAIVGVGGLGSPLAQQLALLGVGHVGLIDPEELDDTNRNRFVGARDEDPVPGSSKVALVERMIREINSKVTVSPVPKALVSEDSFAEIRAADWVFGCFDEYGPRFILNELCAAYAIPFIDLASDADEDGSFGGRVCVTSDGNGCVYCLGELDMEDVRRYLANEEELRVVDAVYGVPRADLGQTGPSVSPLNGVIAAHAAVEFMVAVTGMRKPTQLIKYYGHWPKTTTPSDLASNGCYYCRDIRGMGAEAEAERYLRIPHLIRSTQSAASRN